MVEDVLIKARAIELIRAQEEKKLQRRTLLMVAGGCFAAGILAGMLSPIAISITQVSHAVVIPQQPASPARDDVRHQVP